MDLTDHPVISLYVRLASSKAKGANIVKMFKQFAQDYTTTNEAQTIVLFAHALDELETLGLVKVQHDHSHYKQQKKNHYSYQIQRLLTTEKETQRDTHQ
jgi:hypothetical protein